MLSVAIYADEKELERNLTHPKDDASDLSSNKYVQGREMRARYSWNIRLKLRHRLAEQLYRRRVETSVSK